MSSTERDVRPWAAVPGGSVETHTEHACFNGWRYTRVSRVYRDALGVIDEALSRAARHWELEHDQQAPADVPRLVCPCGGASFTVRQLGYEWAVRCVGCGEVYVGA